MSYALHSNLCARIQSSFYQIWIGHFTNIFVQFKNLKLLL